MSAKKYKYFVMNCEYLLANSQSLLSSGGQMMVISSADHHYHYHYRHTDHVRVTVYEFPLLFGWIELLEFSGTGPVHLVT
jgi:hypothetical protein